MDSCRASNRESQNMIRNAVSKVTSKCAEDNGKAPNPDLDEVRRDRGVNSQGKLPGRGDPSVQS